MMSSHTALLLAEARVADRLRESQCVAVSRLQLRGRKASRGGVPGRVHDIAWRGLVRLGVRTEAG